MATIITYTCPRCHTDIARRLGLIKALVVVCPKCSHNVRISRKVIQQNWEFNFVITSGLIIWLALATATLASGDAAAVIGKKFNLPAATFENRLVIAAMMAIPSLLFALPFAGLGLFMGGLTADRMEAANPPPSDYPPYPSGPMPGQQILGQYGAPLANPPPAPMPPAANPYYQPPPGQPYPSQPVPGQYYQPQPGYPYPPPAPGQYYPSPPWAMPPQPRERSIILRAFFVLFWPVFFLFAGLIIALSVSGAFSAETEELRKKISEDVGRKSAGWLMLGMLVTFVVGCLGWLPWTGRKRYDPPPPQQDPNQPPAAS